MTRRGAPCCVDCGCPLLRLDVAGGPWWETRPPIWEERVRCARCARELVAQPCPVRGCLGVASGSRGVRLCSECRRLRDRAVEYASRARRPGAQADANRRSYERHRETRLKQRRERRAGEDGDALRAAERARYAAKRGGTVRAYRVKP